MAKAQERAAQFLEKTVLQGNFAATLGSFASNTQGKIRRTEDLTEADTIGFRDLFMQLPIFGEDGITRTLRDVVTADKNLVKQLQELTDATIGSTEGLEDNEQFESSVLRGGVLIFKI